MAIRDALHAVMFKVDDKELYTMDRGSKRVGMSNTVWSHFKDYVYPTVTASKFISVRKKRKMPHVLYQSTYRKEASSEFLQYDVSEECAQFQSLLGQMSLAGMQEHCRPYSCPVTRLDMNKKVNIVQCDPSSQNVCKSTSPSNKINHP
jgi:hypothetical protein